jgi:hypothetical protein
VSARSQVNQVEWRPEPEDYRELEDHLLETALVAVEKCLQDPQLVSARSQVNQVKRRPEPGAKEYQL